MMKNSNNHITITGPAVGECRCPEPATDGDWRRGWSSMGPGAWWGTVPQDECAPPLPRGHELGMGLRQCGQYQRWGWWDALGCAGLLWEWEGSSSGGHCQKSGCFARLPCRHRLGTYPRDWLEPRLCSCPTPLMTEGVKREGLGCILWWWRLSIRKVLVAFYSVRKSRWLWGHEDMTNFLFIILMI